MVRKDQREFWSSRFAFIMAAVGSSVGLGNFWRFPFTAGENGGGAFVLIYLGCVALFALPILIAEYAIGRRGGASAPESMMAVAREAGKSPLWAAAAWVGGTAAFLIVTFYFVISSWVMVYVPITFAGTFAGATPEEVAAQFEATITNTTLISIAVGVFILANVIVVARGISKGIEIATEILMPVFFLMLVGIVIYVSATGDFASAAAFLLQPDFSEVSWGTALAAMSQAFFSIGVGAALMVTYGAYLNREQNIPSSAAVVVSADTLVALIAGFAIFPLVFSQGLDPAGGPGLFFVTLPIAFGSIPAGGILGGAFFILALFAAFTSSISLMQVVVAWLAERRNLTRARAAILVGVVSWVIGLGHIHFPALIDLFDAVTEGIGLPLGALLIAVFAGWVVHRVLRDELGAQARWTQRLWPFAIRYFAPIGIALVFIFGLVDVGPKIATYAGALAGQVSAAFAP